MRGIEDRLPQRVADMATVRVQAQSSTPPASASSSGVGLVTLSTKKGAR